MFYKGSMRLKNRLHGMTMLEALVVVAIVSLTTGAAFGLLRQTPIAQTQSLSEQIATRVMQERARAIRSGRAIELSARALLVNSEQICSTGSLTFFPDGSVSASDICADVDGVQRFFRITPIFGNVEAIE